MASLVRSLLVPCASYALSVFSALPLVAQTATPLTAAGDFGRPAIVNMNCAEGYLVDDIDMVTVYHRVASSPAPMAALMTASAPVQTRALTATAVANQIALGPQNRQLWQR
jgi:hypothetical protein